MSLEWTVLVILGLGLWHGINPGMGWLFAVALGMQERDRRSVWQSLLPLAAGHALSIATALLAAALVGAILPPVILKWGVGMVLVGFGVARLSKSRHPRYGGLRMSMRRLTVWSFLMASAHGAGLMVLPFVVSSDFSRTAGEGGDVRRTTRGGRREAGTEGDVLRATDGGTAGTAGSGARTGAAGHGQHLARVSDSGRVSGWIVLAAHTAGYLLATGLLAVLVYEKLGLRMLRSVWLNPDVIWGMALAATGVLAPFV